METLSQTALVLVALCAVAAAMAWFRFGRARNLIERWAQQEDYQILDAQMRVFRRGPFWFSGKHTVVFRVSVRDVYGVQRQGWAKCGSWLAGLMSNQVETRWDG